MQSFMYLHQTGSTLCTVCLKNIRMEKLSKEENLIHVCIAFKQQ